MDRADATPGGPPPGVLERYGFGGAGIEALPGGLINRTFRVDVRGQRYVLQRLNDIFAPEVNDDIAAVTAALAANGVETPHLVPTLDGERWVAADGIWRLLTFVDGVSFESAPGPEHLRSAGALLARFHGALAGLDYEFKAARAGVHDFERHVDGLKNALDAGHEHRDRARLAPLAESILDAAGRLEPLPSLPSRVTHGDPKIANVMFAANEPRARCLVDLDTVSRSHLGFELGDALRSWCATRPEDDPAIAFDAARFDAAVGGYVGAAGKWLEASERSVFAAAAQRIAVELAARFCRDAFEERYFAFDASRFASRADHNAERATAQLALADSIGRQRERLEALGVSAREGR